MSEIPETGRPKFWLEAQKHGDRDMNGSRVSDIPAFPCAHSEQWQSNQDGAPYQAGMTLRDYFAAKALCAITVLDAVPGNPKDTDYFTSVASYAYSVADAMLKAREA